MAYADHSEGSSRTISIVIVALIHAVLGYAFVTGLGYQYIKKAAEQLNVVDVKEEPPPPEEEPPPPPPDQPVQPPPVVTPPAVVQLPSAPVNIAPPPQPVAPYIPPRVLPPAPPPAPPPPPAKVEARGNPGSWVTTDDYPPRALRENRSGTTSFRLGVGADGRATSCDITGSSGSPDLDQEACKNLLRRARFKPGAAGVYSSRVVWQVPKN